MNVVRPSSAPPPGRPEDVQDFLYDPVGCMSRLERLYGRLPAFERGAQMFVFAFGPDYNREIFSNLESFHIVSRLPGPKKSPQRRIGNGLFSMNGDEHRNARRLLMPPFRREALSDYVAPLGDIVAAKLDHWHAGMTFDLMHEMKELTLHIAAQLLFGVDETSLAHNIESAFEDWLRLNHVASFGTQLPVEAPSDSYPELLAAAERLEHHLRTLIETKRKLPGASNDVLGLMLRAVAAGGMSEDVLMGQTFTIFNAAYHTTTYALTWALFLLAQHPHVLQRARDEQRRVLAGAAPTFDALERLTFLDRVVKESLRLLPSISYIVRITSRETSLGRYRLPGGTMVLPSPYVSHHLADAFPNPRRFEPDRWLRPPTPWSYIPFGAGARLCLGAPFALMLVKFTLSLVLQRCVMQVVPGACIERQGTLSLGARYGVPVLLHAPDHLGTASPVSGNIHEMVELSEALQTPAKAA